eukprot:NODE_489_length_6860_cov_1.209289.p8 type:complete len:110 gc:universal NODE_489_length_6860_cov_1.209289:3633-3304(-)
MACCIHNLSHIVHSLLIQRLWSIQLIRMKWGVNLSRCLRVWRETYLFVSICSTGYRSRRCIQFKSSCGRLSRIGSRLRRLCGLNTNVETKTSGCRGCRIRSFWLSSAIT